MEKVGIKKGEREGGGGSSRERGREGRGREGGGKENES